jgi:hypothetical protein
MLIMVARFDYVCTSALHVEADALANVVKMYIFFKLRDFSPLRNIMV